MVEGAKSKKIPTNKARGEILGIGGLCKQNPAPPPKSPRSGVTFHNWREILFGKPKSQVTDACFRVMCLAD